MKSSLRSRSLKLLGLAAKLGREELTQNIKDNIKGALNKGLDEIALGRAKSRIEQAKLIADNLSQLKGAAMKAGQLLSLDAGDYLPPEAIEVLSKLQSSADPVDFAVVREVLNEDLGPKRIAEFDSFNTVAAAAASIGQVHRAKLGGRDVAVKIQYPGVRESIDSDLKLLRTIAQSFVALGGKRVDLTELFDELSIVLKQEADYTQEFTNLDEYRTLLAAHGNFFAPEPIASHSSSRVLTMTWLTGLPFNEWIKTSPTAAARERVARLVLDLYHLEFYEWGLVQTDPNYGNFLIEPESLKLGLLDFGATLRYDEKFRAEYRGLLTAISSLDRDVIVSKFIDWGGLDPRESDETRELFAELLILSAEPFHPSRQPFRFKDADYARRSREVGQKLIQSLKYSPPPRKILFLHRKLGGIFHLLRKLDVELDMSPYWERMVGSTLGSAAGSTRGPANSKDGR